MALEVRIAAGAAHGLVKIDLVAVEIRAVHAGEFHFAADGQAAAAAHARAVHHDRVHGDDGFLAVFLRCQADEFHHDQRPNGDDLVEALATFQQLFERRGDVALLVRIKDKLEFEVKLWRQVKNI